MEVTGFNNLVDFYHCRCVLKIGGFNLRTRVSTLPIIDPHLRWNYIISDGTWFSENADSCFLFAVVTKVLQPVVLLAGK